MREYTLTDSPEQQIQPCWSSCVPTSIAMALGVDVTVILNKIEELGLDYSNGLKDEAIAFLLVFLGIGSTTFLPTGVALLDGHYLAQVTSLNKIGYTHCVFLHIEDRVATIYDPNNGRGDELAYYDDFEETPILSITKLDDFKEYK